MDLSSNGLENACRSSAVGMAWMDGALAAIIAPWACVGRHRYIDHQIMNSITAALAPDGLLATRQIIACELDVYIQEAPKTQLRTLNPKPAAPHISTRTNMPKKPKTKGMYGLGERREETDAHHLKLMYLRA